MHVTINGTSFAAPPSAADLVNICPPEIGVSPFQLRAQFREEEEILGLVVAEAPDGGRGGWAYLTALAWDPRRETLWERRNDGGCIHLRRDGADPCEHLASAFARLLREAWNVANPKT